MDYVQGDHYKIESLRVMDGCPNFPIADAEFIRSYEHYGKTSRVFRYAVEYDAFFVEWIQCWVHIAANYTLVNGISDGQQVMPFMPFIIESHIHDDRIKSISKHL